MPLIFGSLFTSNPAHAEIRTYIGIGEYIMSDFETLEVAKQRAKSYAERNAQEQAGVCVQSYTHILNSQVTEDEIVTITNGIINVTDVNYEMIPLANNTIIMFRARIKAEIDTDEIQKWLERGLQERTELINQNQELQKAIAEQDRIIAELRSQLGGLQTQQQKDYIANEYAAADKNFRSNKKVEEASKYFERGDFEGAITLLNEALILNPNNGFAYELRGSANGNIQDYNTAINDFNMAMQLGLINDFNYYCRGLAFEKQHNYYQAAVDFTRALEINPRHSDAYFNRGMSYLNLGNYKEAISDFNRVIEFNTRLTEAYYCRGYCYQVLGNYIQANADFERSRAYGYR